MKVTKVILCLILGALSLNLWAGRDVKEFKDILWAQPEGFKLTADVYTQETKKKLPVLIIFHGGGWLLNSKDIMSDLAKYVASNTDMVVVNANYRLLADVNNSTTMNQIVEDAMGAVLWVKDNIAQYHGDPSRIAITGDSAGGHLAAMIVMAGNKLESDGFQGASLGFKPTYLPKGKSVKDIAQAGGIQVQAAILSYPALDLRSSPKQGFETANNPFWGWAKAQPRGMFGAGNTIDNHPEYYAAVSPVTYLDGLSKNSLPPELMILGESDPFIPREVVQQYVDAVKASGNDIQFELVKDRGHGFLDAGCNDYNHGCFKDLAFPTVEHMVTFLNSVFYPK